MTAEDDVRMLLAQVGVLRGALDQLTHDYQPRSERADRGCQRCPYGRDDPRHWTVAMLADHWGFPL